MSSLPKTPEPTDEERAAELVEEPLLEPWDRLQLAREVLRLNQVMRDQARDYLATEKDMIECAIPCALFGLGCVIIGFLLPAAVVEGILLSGFINSRLTLRRMQKQVQETYESDRLMREVMTKLEKQLGFKND